MDTDAGADDQQSQLLMGLDDVLGELLTEHGWTADELTARCADIIEDATNDPEREPSDETEREGS